MNKLLWAFRAIQSLTQKSATAQGIPLWKTRHFSLLPDFAQGFFRLSQFTDIAPMLAAGQNVLRKYKAIYLQADARTDQWNDVISIPEVG